MMPRVKEMPERELADLARDVRAQILKTVAANGGHLAASLGAVELAIGLLRVFCPPEDKVLWDVGHQAYAWKILTGRGERFGTLRRHGGLAPFLNPEESEADAFISGHAGSALAAAVGLAAARDRKGGGHVVAVVGDAALTNGETLEALNACTALTRKVIVVVNDNAMSISQNVGAFARQLGRLLGDVRYNRAKAAAERVGHRMRLTFLRAAYHRLERALKSFWLRNAFFESFGLRYIGPVDGHSLKAVTSALMVAKEDKRSVVVHVVTTKGKGFPPAEANPAAWHGVGPFALDDATDGAGEAPIAKGGAPTWSDVFGEALMAEARADSRVCAVVAAMKDGTGLTAFADAFPDRFFDVGICEELAVTFAAGLAKAGMRPVVAIYSSFLQRAIDQIQHDVCLQRLPVTFAIDRAGCVGADGATHHGLYDIPLLRPLTGLRILAPTCADELKTLLHESLTGEGPAAIRYPRGAAASCRSPARVAAPGVTLYAVGDQVGKAEKVAALLGAKGLAAEVVPVSRVKPAAVARDGRARLTATLENGVVNGGFGESIGADLRFGWPDAIVRHGTVDELERDFGFDAETIAEEIWRNSMA